MRFIECYVENFGKLRSFKYSFEQGLNTILAENGYGKTTLAAFLKCMLYGMEDTKRQDLSENDRKHYMPWQGGRCGGYLTLEQEGRRYKIERSFGHKAAEDSFALYDLDTGRLSDDYTSALGEEMLGIDRDGFERTLFLSERRLSGKNENKTVSARLSELVGCDGDIGGVDAAMKRLEEKRKYYKKTGGRGRIDELSGSISVCAQNIAALERARESSRDLEAMLVEQKEEIGRLEERLGHLTAERERLRLRKSRQALTEQYAENMTRLTRDRARCSELRARLGESVPTPDEIDAASYGLREAERLSAMAGESEDDREYAVLKLRFGGKTDITEMERATASAERISACRAEIATLESIPVATSKFFTKRIPEREELLSAKGKAGGALGIAGIIAAVTAIPLFFLSIYAGIALMAVGIVLLGAATVAMARKNQSTEELLRGLSDEPIPDAGEREAYVDMLLSELEGAKAAERLALEAERRRDALNAEIGELLPALRRLLERIGAPTDDPVGEIARQRDDFIRYYQLSLSVPKGAEERLAAQNRAAELRARASEFLARFEGLSDSPFEELKDMLAEYQVLSASVTELERQCASLRERYGIDGSEAVYDPEEAIKVETSIRELEESLRARQKEYTAGEVRLASDAESYERVYELKARMAELTAERTAAENELDTVLGAKKYITAAMESMTSKYLGKTRDGFAKYREMIEGAGERDFLMDTSFALSVSDGGSTHPEEAFSRGTRDLYAIAIRLALSDALYVGELPPIILDDPFTALDDERLERALALIGEIAKERQIIYFTCQRGRKP